MGIQWAAICTLTASCFLTQHHFTMICGSDDASSYLLSRSGCRWAASSPAHCLHFPGRPHWPSSCPLQSPNTGGPSPPAGPRSAQRLTVTHTPPQPRSPKNQAKPPLRAPLREWDRDGVLTGAVADRVLALREDGWRRCWR